MIGQTDDGVGERFLQFLHGVEPHKIVRRRINVRAMKQREGHARLAHNFDRRPHGFDGVHARGTIIGLPKRAICLMSG